MCVDCSIVPMRRIRYYPGPIHLRDYNSTIWSMLWYGGYGIYLTLLPQTTQTEISSLDRIPFTLFFLLSLL